MDEFIQKGWNYHDSESERLGAELEAMQLSELTVENAEAFLHLANHTLGEHLGDWPRARQLAEAVCQESTVATESPGAWSRYAVACHMCGDTLNAQVAELNGMRRSKDALLVSLETRVLISIALLGSARGEEGRRLYTAVVELAENLATRAESSATGVATQPGKLGPLYRMLAVASNNIASQLLEEVRRTPLQDALMRQSAQASLAFWKRCGTWENEERGMYLQALVENALGEHETALSHTGKALEVILTNGAEPVDEAFIRLAAAEAHFRLGDPDQHRSELHKADELAASWEDESLRNWFAEERKKIPV